MKEEYKSLFEPIEIGNMLIPKRICHVPSEVTVKKNLYITDLYLRVEK